MSKGEFGERPPEDTGLYGDLHGRWGWPVGVHRAPAGYQHPWLVVREHRTDGAWSREEARQMEDALEAASRQARGGRNAMERWIIAFDESTSATLTRLEARRRHQPVAALLTPRAMVYGTRAKARAALMAQYGHIEYGMAAMRRETAREHSRVVCLCDMLPVWGAEEE